MAEAFAGGLRWRWVQPPDEAAGCGREEHHATLVGGACEEFREHVRFACLTLGFGAARCLVLVARRFGARGEEARSLRLTEKVVHALGAILRCGEAGGTRNRCAHEVEARQFLPLGRIGSNRLAIGADRAEHKRIGG
jgi:hypothetical protein